MVLREGPSAALVSFAELGGAEEEEEVGAGSDAARFLGAPLVYFFLVGASECVRAPLLGGKGVGGGPGGRGSWNRGRNAA